MATAARRGLGESLSARFPQLPRGRSSLPEEFIEEYQRQRIVAALADVVHEKGAADLAARQVIAAAHVSPATFYEFFANKDECFDYACSEAMRQFLEPVEAAYEEPGDWVERLTAALHSFLVGVSDEPRLAELALIHSRARESRGRSWYGDAVELFVRILGDRPAGRSATAPIASPLREKVMASAIVALVAERLREDRLEPIERLLEELVWLATSPFLDGEAPGEVEAELVA